VSEVIDQEVIEEEDVPGAGLAVREIGAALNVDELVRRVETVEEAMERAMKPEIDYGHIPGINKPTLLKPGAEKLCVLFQLGPTYPSDRQEVVKGTDGHLDVVSVCALRHIPTGALVAEGVSYASSRESKYAYRQGSRSCPECGEDTIKKGRTRDKSAAQFYCYRKIGGCGWTADEGTPEFDKLEETDVSKVPNPDLPDTYNTVLKMGAKRALIAAVLNATGASSIFTQDVEDAKGEPAADDYGAAGAATVAEQPPIPKSWAALAVALKEIHVDEVWMVQALEAGFGTAKTSELPQAKKDLAFQTMCTAYVRIHALMMASGDTATVGAPTFTQIREGFASVLDGLELAGPPTGEAA
jgi:predicted RNA-binding Zn-ribbon protein involved in translation (DUF1610 family)